MLLLMGSVSTVMRGSDHHIVSLPPLAHKVFESITTRQENV
jgi:hypothetical protein